LRPSIGSFPSTFNELTQRAAARIFRPVESTGAMMKEIQASEAKTHLAELLRAVERGESFAITRHGRAIARLVPAAAVDEAARRAAVDRFRALRQGWEPASMTADEILAARHEGHWA
jgi:prevent-host-death family protein